MAKYKTLAELVKGAAEAQGLAGKKTLNLEEARAAGRRIVEVPAADAPPEKWAEFYAAVGRPEKPADYQFQAPDGFTLNGPELDKVKERFHKIGLTPTQFTDVFGAYVEHELSAWNAAQNVIDQRAADTRAKLGQEFGALAGKKLETVSALFAQPKYQALGEALKEGGLGTDHRVVRAMIEFAEATSEDTAVGQAKTIAGIDDQIATLVKSPAYLNGADPNHQKLMTQIQALTTQKHRAKGAPV